MLQTKHFVLKLGGNDSIKTFIFGRTRGSQTRGKISDVEDFLAVLGRTSSSTRGFRITSSSVVTGHCRGYNREIASSDGARGSIRSTVVTTTCWKRRLESIAKGKEKELLLFHGWVRGLVVPGKNDILLVVEGVCLKKAPRGNDVKKCCIGTFPTISSFGSLIPTLCCLDNKLL